MEAVFEREARGEVGVFLIDRDGAPALVGGRATRRTIEASLAGPNLVRDFARSR